MASNGSIPNGFRNGYGIKIYWVVNSQNVANNTSNVTVNAQLYSTGSSYTISSSATKNGSLTINGTTYNFTFNASLSGNQTKTVYSKTVDITHNSDGTKSCSFATTLGINVTLGGTYHGNVSANGTGAFNNIPRTSSMSLSHSSIDAGATIRIDISSASGSFDHMVYYSFGGYKITLNNGNRVATTVSLAIPMDHLSAIPNSTSGTATISVDTYSGSTFIGSTSKNFTITVPSHVRPSFSSLSASLISNGIDGSYGYLKGKSSVQLSIYGATQAYGSPVTYFYIEGGGYSATQWQFTTGTINTSGSITFSAYIRDSRGRQSDTKTISISVSDYIPPKINSFSAIRSNASGDVSNEGGYIAVRSSFSHTSLDGKNTLSSMVYYKLTGATDFSSGVPISNETLLVLGNDDISTESTYEVKIVLKDNFPPSVEQSAVIGTAFITMDFKRGGRGIAIGKASETDDLFEVAVDTKFNKKVIFSKDTNVISIGSDGVMEVKKYIDFHDVNSNTDYDVRLQCNGNTLHTTGNTSLSGYIQLPNYGSSWLEGATKGNIRGNKQSQGSYHPIISQTTYSNHKVSLGGIDNKFGFFLYDANRTENGVDREFAFNLNDKTFNTNCASSFPRVHVNDWVYCHGNTGLYFNTYGGGWSMTDGSWIRAYGDKNIYTGGRVKANVFESRYIDGTGGNLEINAGGGTLFINANATSGANLNVNRTWSGSSGSETSIYNSKGKGWGFLGNTGWEFYRVYGTGGSVSARESKYKIMKADEETQYENVKSISIYNYRTLSSCNKDIEELAKDILSNSEFKCFNSEENIFKYTVESFKFNEFIYKELSETLTQEEIKKERIKEIINNHPELGELKRQDLMLGCMVDELPTETVFYDNEGGDGRAVDIYSYATMGIGAIKHLITKVEKLEQEKSDLEIRVEKLEEFINGFINKE